MKTHIHHLKCAGLSVYYINPKKHKSKKTWDLTGEETYTDLVLHCTHYPHSLHPKQLEHVPTYTHIWKTILALESSSRTDVWTDTILAIPELQPPHSLLKRLPLRRRSGPEKDKTTASIPSPEKFPWMAWVMPVARCRVMLYKNMAPFLSVASGVADRALTPAQICNQKKRRTKNRLHTCSAGQK